MIIKAVKIEAQITKEVIDSIKVCNDPFIVDIRNEKDELLKSAYKRDYMWLKELTNKGVTDIYFRSKTAGTMKLRRVLDKVTFFGRELVVLYKDDQHLKAFKRLVNEQGRTDRDSKDR
jgi:hypothetical protein